jgi:hypothetical protein
MQRTLHAAREHFRTVGHYEVDIVSPDVPFAWPGTWIDASLFKGDESDAQITHAVHGMLQRLQVTIKTMGLTVEGGRVRLSARLQDPATGAFSFTVAFREQADPALEILHAQ